MKKFENVTIKHDLTEDDMLKFGGQLAEATQALDRLEDQLKAVKAQFKHSIEMETARMKYAASCLNNGYEHREVECEVVRDYDAKKIRWIRADSGEEIKSREMTQRELQMGIDDV